MPNLELLPTHHQSVLPISSRGGLFTVPDRPSSALDQVASPIVVRGEAFFPSPIAPVLDVHADGDEIVVSPVAPPPSQDASPKMLDASAVDQNDGSDDEPLYLDVSAVYGPDQSSNLTPDEVVDVMIRHAEADLNSTPISGERVANLSPDQVVDAMTKQAEAGLNPASISEEEGVGRPRVDGPIKQTGAVFADLHIQYADSSKPTVDIAAVARERQERVFSNKDQLSEVMGALASKRSELEAWCKLNGCTIDHTGKVINASGVEMNMLDVDRQIKAKYESQVQTVMQELMSGKDASQITDKDFKDIVSEAEEKAAGLILRTAVRAEAYLGGMVLQAAQGVDVCCPGGLHQHGPLVGGGLSGQALFESKSTITRKVRCGKITECGDTKCKCGKKVHFHKGIIRAQCGTCNIIFDRS